MKNLKLFSKTFPIAAIFALVVLGCSMSTANLSSMKVGTGFDKDKEVTGETDKFKPGDTIYSTAVVSNNPGKVTVKFYLTDSTGKTIPGSDVSVNLSGEINVATYNLTLPASAPPGTYKLTADMLNENGEKKDSKSSSITVAE